MYLVTLFIWVIMIISRICGTITFLWSHGRIAAMHTLAARWRWWRSFKKNLNFLKEKKKEKGEEKENDGSRSGATGGGSSSSSYPANHQQWPDVNFTAHNFTESKKKLKWGGSSFLTVELSRGNKEVNSWLTSRKVSAGKSRSFSRCLLLSRRGSESGDGWVSLLCRWKWTKAGKLLTFCNFSVSVRNAVWWAGRRTDLFIRVLCGLFLPQELILTTSPTYDSFIVFTVIWDEGRGSKLAAGHL